MAECPTEFAQSSLLQPRPGTVIRKSASRGYARLVPYVPSYSVPSRACRRAACDRSGATVAVQVQASDGRREGVGGPSRAAGPTAPPPIPSREMF